MKRILTIMAFIAIAVLTATAQTGFAVGRLFDSGYEKRENVTVVEANGKLLKVYGLSQFRSMTVAGDSALADEMERAVNADAEKAVSKEVSLKGGRLYYGIFSFPKEGGLCHIFYRNNSLRKGAKPETTVIYMEGTATIAELKKHFFKSNK